MKISRLIQSVCYPALLAVTALPTTAMAQISLAVAKAASEPEMYREAPGYPLLPVALLALFGLFALLAVLATVCTVFLTNRNKRLESLVEELIRTEAKRAELQDADRRTREQ